MDVCLRSGRGEMWVMCGAVVLALWTGAPSRAGACSPGPAFLRAAEGVPLEGPILVDVTCTSTDFCQMEDPTLEVTSEGEIIEGTWNHVRSETQLFMAWVPDASLQDGGTYQVTHPDGFYEGSGLSAFEVTADSAVRWEEPALDTAKARLDAVRRPVGESFCCEQGYACGDIRACFTEQAVRRARLRVDGGFEAPPLVLYRLRWESAEGGTEQVTSWRRYSSGLNVVFEQPAGPYCATLEARNLRDATTHQQELCVENESGTEFGERVAPSWELNATRLSSCTLPPGLEEDCDPQQEDNLCAVRSQPLVDAWCEAWSESCDQGQTDGNCVQVRAYCTDDSPGQDAGQPDSGPVADAGQPDSGPVADAGPPHADSGSCAVASGGSSGTTAALWLLAWLVIRVRRMPPSRAR